MAKRPQDGPKSIKVTVFLPFGKGSHVRLFHAGKGLHFTESDIDQALDKLAAALEVQMPGHEFRLVDVSARKQARFNFIWVRELPRIPPAEIPAEASASG